MRQRFIIITILAVFLSLTFIIQHFYFPKLQGQPSYFFVCTYWIVSILILILAVDLTWRRFFVHKKPAPVGLHVEWANRRNTFRIIYPPFIRPVLIVSEVDNNPKRHLEFPVMDLSQGGSCFLDDGSLGAMKHFSGHIRFNDGSQLAVAGKFIRKTGNQISVQFLNTIDWSILLNEQRRVLVQMKARQ